VTVDSLWLLCLLLFLDGATTAAFTTPLLLLYAKSFAPWQVAVAGGVASAAGSVVQLALFRWMLASGRPWMTRFLPSRQKLEQTLERYPSASFLAIAIARATPLPDAPIKLVAAVVGYPLWRYFAAVLTGALPYYFALAWAGHELPIPPWAIFALAGALLVGLVVDLVRKSRAPRA
jgi:uncharacterized membrane protein YdjX (TVP38/TMEM64 family)